MLVFDYKIDESILAKNTIQYLKPGMLFWDIETTGLSAERETIYLIGTGFMNEQKELIVRLFFAENQSAEKDVIHAFLSFRNEFDVLITFNGHSFDRNFISKRAALYDMFPDWDSYKQIDLFRVVKNIKGFFKLCNYKQKTVECWYGIGREDLYNGGQLISFYHDYTKDQDPKKLECLLLHNKEDIIGMFSLYSLVSYEQLLTDKVIVTSVDIDCECNQRWLGINFDIEGSIPKSLSIVDENNRIMLRNSYGRIETKIDEVEVNHYFEDYQQYVYLLEEDCVVHKSVGQFVDPSHRRKARKEECFVKKQAFFVKAYCASELNFFRKDLKEKATYLEIPNEESCLNEKEFLNNASLFVSALLKEKAGEK